MKAYCFVTPSHFLFILKATRGFVLDRYFSILANLMIKSYWLKVTEAWIRVLSAEVKYDIIQIELLGLYVYLFICGSRSGPP